MRGSRNLRQGGPGQSDKKALTTFFLVLSLFYRSQLVNFEEIYHLSMFKRGSNIFQGGGVQLFSGGSNCLFPIETHITCDFPGGGVWIPCPPSGSALELCPEAILHRSKALAFTFIMILIFFFPL